MPTTESAVLTTQEVANRFNELAQSGQWDKIQEELFSEDSVSIEPPHGVAMGMSNAAGIAAIKAKGEAFGKMVEEMHGGYSTPPVVGGNFFSVAMGMDVTMKGAGRVKMDEVAVYEVKNGKIVSEQFFY
jgi:SnoaL-like domain